MNIKLLQGDCLELMKDIPNKSVNAIVTDPPYLYLDHRLDRPFDEDAVFGEWDRVLKDDGFIVLFGRGESFYRWNTKLIDLGFKFKEEVIWDKRRISSPMTPLSRVHETISLLSKTGKVNTVKLPYVEQRKYDAERVFGDLARLRSVLGKHSFVEEVANFIENNLKNYSEASKSEGLTVQKKLKTQKREMGIINSFVEGLKVKSIISQTTDSYYNSIHPTQKPVQLMETLIKLVTNEGDVVLDSFVGSGSTPIACINTDRRFIGYEIDEGYFGLAKERIESHKEQLTLV